MTVLNINPIEQEIIKTFVRKNKQDRLIWELGNIRKRADIIWHFSNCNIFKEECLHPINYMDKVEMIKYLFQLGKNKKVYFIGESLIGELSLNQSAELASHGEISITYCGNGIAYYQGEQEYGSPPRFLLLKNK